MNFTVPPPLQEINMDNIIVYLDDAAHAEHQLAPMQASRLPTHWVLVACPPRMTRRISKWVSHSARENWRAKWAENLFQQIAPQLRAAGGSVTELVAQGPLPELTAKLSAKHNATRVLDARRPKFGQELPPVMAGQPADNDRAWEVPGAVAGMGALLVLAAE
jgi:hypothetical protein